jgi:hypothetical protein
LLPELNYLAFQSLSVPDEDYSRSDNAMVKRKRTTHDLQNTTLHRE